MYLNKPEKFSPTGVGSNPLIGLKDIIIKQSTKIQPEINNDDHWTSEKNYDPDVVYNWIKMSVDGGDSWSFIYKLNNSNNVSFSFNLSELIYEPNNFEYPYYFRYIIPDKDVYDSIKNKPLSLFIGTEEETVSFQAPIRYKIDNSKYYIDILFTEAFKTQFVDCTCYVNNK